MSARDLFGTITSLHFSRSRMFELDRRTVWRRSALCHRACQEGRAAMKNRPLSRVELITSWEKAKDLYDWVERKKEKNGPGGSEKRRSDCVFNRGYHGNSWWHCFGYASKLQCMYTEANKNWGCGGCSASAVVICLQWLDAALFM